MTAQCSKTRRGQKPKLPPMQPCPRTPLRPQRFQHRLAVSAVLQEHRSCRESWQSPSEAVAPVALWCLGCPAPEEDPAGRSVGAASAAIPPTRTDYPPTWGSSYQQTSLAASYGSVGRGTTSTNGTHVQRNTESKNRKRTPKHVDQERPYEQMGFPLGTGPMRDHLGW